jgi:glycosyltransferase involved in cell wall biosynthesis
MPRVSVCIPSRNEPFLNRTINEVLSKARGDVECIAYLDGEPETEPLPDDKRVVVVRGAKSEGIGAAMTVMARNATGEYIMKLDAHCALGEGYDVAMAEHCGERDLLVPARYQLKPEAWQRGYGPIHYLYPTYPWLCEPQCGAGIHGKKWVGESGLEGSYWWPEKARRDKPLDDIMTFQGSCYFMRRDRFIALGGVDPQYVLYQEATTIGMKVWLSGGRCLRDKSTWYAHLHKGAKFGRGYFINKAYSIQMNMEAADLWLNDRWQHPLKERPFKWFVEHFWPIPGWPEDWDNPRYQAEFRYPDERNQRIWERVQRGH